MKNIYSLLNAIFSWIFVFGISILSMAKVIQWEGVTIVSFWVFLVVAIMSSAVASGKKSRKMAGSDVRINFAGNIYTGDALTVIDMLEGGTYIIVDLSKGEGWNDDEGENDGADNNLSESNGGLLRAGKYKSPNLNKEHYAGKNKK